MHHHHLVAHRLAAAALLAASLLPAARAQQGLDLSAGPVDYTTWTLFGSATAQNTTPGNGFTYSLLSLTNPGTGDQAGAAFAPQALALDFNQPFSFHFNWYIPLLAEPGLRGDGMAFVLTTQPGLGVGGSGLGYDGSHPASVAWAIDTFHFDGEPVSPSLQILAGGSVAPLAATETGLGDRVRDPDFQWFGQFDYLPSGLDDNRGTLTASMSHVNLGSFSASAGVDFDALGMASAGAVFYGFTASNGLATDGHATSWGAPVPVPEPQTWLLMAAGLGMVGWLARRRAA
ncbi:MAG TPA: PEP-CTERM sorting domain-containing protein [Aquabacterium sp.]|nr:PEP-CTERM sorting domain-containing protein [Aquabacterium sp.]HQC97185.1 PEP-CTERM sorting domain-containing protein [Aquabacterium sp.]